MNVKKPKMDDKSESATINIGDIHSKRELLKKGLEYRSGSVSAADKKKAFEIAYSEIEELLQTALKK